MIITQTNKQTNKVIYLIILNTLFATLIQINYTTLLTSYTSYHIAFYHLTFITIAVICTTVMVLEMVGDEYYTFEMSLHLLRWIWLIIEIIDTIIFYNGIYIY